MFASITMSNVCPALVVFFVFIFINFPLSFSIYSELVIVILLLLLVILFISVVIMSCGTFIKKLPFFHGSWFWLSFAVALIVNFSFFSVTCVDNVFLLNVKFAVEKGAS